VREVAGELGLTAPREKDTEDLGRQAVGGRRVEVMP